MEQKKKLIPKKYLLTFILVTSLFALWGFANDITNPMVAAFQTVMELSAAKASLIQFAFYGGYATMAIPAALFIRKFSYKKGILLGLALIQSAKNNPKSLIKALLVIVGIAALVAIAYALSSGDPVVNVKNQPSATWLKLTDTIMLLVYILGGAAILSILFGVIRNAITNK